jgi:hypothetical protein
MVSKNQMASRGFVQTFHNCRRFLLLAPIVFLPLTIWLIHSWFSARPWVRSSAEDEVYEVVVRSMIKAEPGAQAPKELLFSNLADTVLCPSVGNSQCAEAIRLRFTRAADGKIRKDTIEDFTKQNQIEGLLSTTFHIDFPHSFIDLDRICNDISTAKGVGASPVCQLPSGANGIISISHVGFDSTGREAIVAASFWCGPLCGEGRRYVLRKKWGKWTIVDQWTEWVS